MNLRPFPNQGLSEALGWCGCDCCRYSCFQSPVPRLQNAITCRTKRSNGNKGRVDTALVTRSDAPPGPRLQPPIIRCPRFGACSLHKVLGGSYSDVSPFGPKGPKGLFKPDTNAGATQHEVGVLAFRGARSKPLVQGGPSMADPIFETFFWLGVIG